MHVVADHDTRQVGVTDVGHRVVEGHVPRASDVLDAAVRRVARRLHQVNGRVHHLHHGIVCVGNVGNVRDVVARAVRGVARSRAPVRLVPIYPEGAVAGPRSRGGQRPGDGADGTVHVVADHDVRQIRLADVRHRVVEDHVPRAADVLDAAVRRVARRFHQVNGWPGIAEIGVVVIHDDIPQKHPHWFRAIGELAGEGQPLQRAARCEVAVVYLHPVGQPIGRQAHEVIPAMPSRGARILAGGHAVLEGVIGSRLEACITVVQVQVHQHAVNPRLPRVLLAIAIAIAPDGIADGGLARREDQYTSAVRLLRQRPLGAQRPRAVGISQGIVHHGRVDRPAVRLQQRRVFLGCEENVHREAGPRRQIAAEADRQIAPVNLPVVDVIVGVGVGELAAEAVGQVGGIVGVPQRQGGDPTVAGVGDADGEAHRLARHQRLEAVQSLADLIIRHDVEPEVVAGVHFGRHHRCRDVVGDGVAIGVRRVGADVLRAGGPVVQRPAGQELAGVNLDAVGVRPQLLETIEAAPVGDVRSHLDGAAVVEIDQHVGQARLAAILLAVAVDVPPHQVAQNAPRLDQHVVGGHQRPHRLAVLIHTSDRSRVDAGLAGGMGQEVHGQRELLSRGQRQERRQAGVPHHGRRPRRPASRRIGHHVRRGHAHASAVVAVADAQLRDGIGAGVGDADGEGDRLVDRGHAIRWNL